MTTKEEPRIKVRLLYAGLVATVKGWAHEWIPLPENWERLKKVPDDKRVVYMMKNSHMAVGNVYEFDAPPDRTDSTIFVNSGRYVARWKDTEWIAETQLVNDTKKQMRELEAREKKDKRRKAYLEVLEPIRRAYQYANPSEKNLIMARVARAIASRTPLVGKDDE